MAIAVHFGYPLPLSREREDPSGEMHSVQTNQDDSSQVESSRSDENAYCNELLMVVYLLTDDFQHMFMENNISFGSLKVATEKL